jgi:hypothetical protein
VRHQICWTPDSEVRRTKRGRGAQNEFTQLATSFAEHFTKFVVLSARLAGGLLQRRNDRRPCSFPRPSHISDVSPSAAGVRDHREVQRRLTPQVGHCEATTRPPSRTAASRRSRPGRQLAARCINRGQWRRLPLPLESSPFPCRSRWRRRAARTAVERPSTRPSVHKNLRGIDCAFHNARSSRRLNYRPTQVRIRPSPKQTQWLPCDFRRPPCPERPGQSFLALHQRQ